MYVGYLTPAHNCDVRRPLQNINQFHNQQIRQQFHPFHSHLLRSSNKIFDSRLFRHNKIFWKKILKEACSPLFYTSFGTFCAQIGQLFELQWIFEVCLKSTNCPHGRKMLLISEFFRLLKDSFVSLHERLSVKNSFSTYACYAQDFFWGWICIW